MMKRKITALIFAIIIATSLIVFVLLNNKTKKKNFIFWTIQLRPIYEKQINSVISQFELRHPDYKVVWIDIPIQEAQKRILASILSSTPPDLVNLNPDFSLILAQRNVLQFFDKEDTQQYLPQFVDKLKYNGKIYALPFYATSSVTIYNKKLYNKCMPNMINTFDELFVNSSKLKKCSGISPFVLGINENDTLAKILNKYDIASFENENDLNKTYKIYNEFNKMYRNNELPKDILTINHREVIEKFMSNEVLITIAGSNFIKMIKQNAPLTYPNLAITPQLTGTSGKYDVALMNLIIPDKAKNKELAKEFALILTNYDNQMDLAKLTNVLPANKYALDDNYFKTCSNDLIEQARCISVKQLKNLSNKDFGTKNKKETNKLINETLEEILLNKNSSDKHTKEKINDMAQQFSQLNKN